MRKFLPIVISMLALIACFIVYMHFQPKFNFNIADKPPPDVFGPAGAGGNGAFVKPGHAAWVVQYDKEGKRAYQFKSDYYDNQPDGTVKVTKPVIEFFLSDDQILHIEGDDGIVRLAPGTDKGALGGAPPEPPRYGTLRHVIVKLFSSAAQQQRNRADMTITMTNAQFDNDTYRLFTHEYTDAGGKVIYADQVPVTVWAKDYFFTGWGMVMYWNGLDKRLQSLEIAHSRDLTVYNPSVFEGASVSTTPPPPLAAQAADVKPTPVVTSNAAAVPVPSARQRYLATFLGNVQVWQGGERLMHTPEQMTVDFIPKGGPGPSAEPTPAPSKSTALASSAPSPGAVASATPTPAVQQEPMHVYWTGKMRMVPIDDATAEPLADGKAIIHVIGAPVLLHQAGNERQQTVDVQCASAIYRTADSSAHLEGDAQTPLVMKQTRADGAISSLAGPSLDYSKLDGIATIHGKGSAAFPDNKDPSAVLNASWGKQCVAHLIASGKNQMQITEADLFGNVVADHPRFHLTAIDDLKLTFDPAAANGNSSSPQLQKMIANGDVRCVLHEANHHNRAIAGQTLQLFTAMGTDGKTYPHLVQCDGAVVAEEIAAEGDEQKLQAEHLQATLQPAPAKDQKNIAQTDEMANVTLDQLIATTHVRLSGKNSSFGSADRLEMRMVDQHPRITLSGNAQVGDKTSRIAGPIIHVSPHDQTASVDGPGTLDALQKPDDPSKKPKPLHLTWQTGANLDGNNVVVQGDAAADSKNPDGSDDTAHSDRILVTLADAGPATHPSENAPATRPSNADAADLGDMDFMKNKQVQKLSLLADDTVGPATTRPAAQIGSEMPRAGQLPLHKYDLWGRRIDYDAVARRLSVPGAGTIRAEQHQAASTQPTTQPDAGGHGVSKIQWQTRFVYDEGLRTALIEGNVLIEHVDDGADPQPVHLLGADQVRVELEPDDKAATRPNTHSAVAGDDQPAMKIRRVVAAGPITIKTTDKTIRCGEVEFDPIDSRLYCRGGELGQVTVVDNHNIENNGTFSEVQLNTATNTLEKLVHFTGQGR